MHIFKFKTNPYYFILFYFIISLKSYAYIDKNYTNDRELFLKIESELKKGKNNLFLKHQKQIAGYPLYPYLKYLEIKQKFKTVNLKEINSFLDSYHDFPYANNLRDEWLSYNAKKERWNNFLKSYKNNNNTVQKCQFVHGHYETYKKDEILKYTDAIWLSGNSLPKECDKVLSNYEKKGFLTTNKKWQRIKLSIQNKNYNLARYIATKLNKKEQALVELWIRVDSEPDLIKKNYYFTTKCDIAHEILTHGLIKIAKKHPELSIKIWKKIIPKYSFTKRQSSVISRTIGISLAGKNPIEAKKWLQQVPLDYANDEVFNALLKIFLQTNSWQEIINLYNNVLPEKFLKQEKWQYWLAKSLELTNNTEKSQAIYKKIAKNRSYYGFLASTRVIKPYAFQNQPQNFTVEELKKIANNKIILRAYELFKLDRITLGTKEWLTAVRKMNEHEKQIAAKLASAWNNPNWSILALQNATNKNNLTLRFPKNYSEFILKESKINNLDPALIFAITRQESAFLPNAKSSAGALGLMQVIPSTGRMVAKMENITFKNQNDLFEADKNIKIGSKYFKMMLEKNNNNVVLAAAAYNAGPRRIESWIPENDMPADVWIELIPYQQTKDYVQNILSYTLIYQKLLKNKPVLSVNMPIVNGIKKT